MRDARSAPEQSTRVSVHAQKRRYTTPPPQRCLSSAGQNCHRPPFFFFTASLASHLAARGEAGRGVDRCQCHNDGLEFTSRESSLFFRKNKQKESFSLNLDGIRVREYYTQCVNSKRDTNDVRISSKKAEPNHPAPSIAPRPENQVHPIAKIPMNPGADP